MRRAVRGYAYGEVSTAKIHREGDALALYDADLDRLTAADPRELAQHRGEAGEGGVDRRHACTSYAHADTKGGIV